MEDVLPARLLKKQPVITQKGHKYAQILEGNDCICGAELCRYTENIKSGLCQREFTFLNHRSLKCGAVKLLSQVSQYLTVSEIVKPWTPEDDCLSNQESLLVVLRVNVQNYDFAHKCDECQLH